MDEQDRAPEGGRRPYRLKERAVRQEETRRRITEAAVALHQERGPLATTISAIAERAGVQRLTVYRHFPEEASLFAACTRHYFSLHPFPDPAAWSEIGDPVARLHSVLGELYAYWGRTEQMFSAVLRDAEVDAERSRTAPLAAYLSHARNVLVAGWRVRGRRRRLLVGVVGHAVQFHTWRSLVRDHDLSDAEAVDLMVMLVSEAMSR
ncbi:MAG: TetR/AcrR family transcriptional regulator [Acidimicrobiia bacterium]